MAATSGDLDPAAGIIDAATPLSETVAQYKDDVQSLAADSAAVGEQLDRLRDRYFLAWDDDGGDGYASALTWVAPRAGDYALIVAGALSAFGRSTSGDYELRIGLNAPAAGEPAGEPIAEPVQVASGLASSVQEASGTLTAAAPIGGLALGEISAGQTLTAYAEGTSGNLVPALILRDYGSKAFAASNLGGQDSQATIQYRIEEGAVGYSLEVRAAPLADGTPSEGNYRVVVGLNAPEVLTGQAQPHGNPLFVAPIEVQAGLKLLRISAVNSPDENFTVLGSLRMDWTDPALAFSPDSCNCSIKLYTDKEFDRFLADVKSRWPAFTFFNQLGNRWIQSRAAAIWPDGRARYAESFNTTFQADFDFREYPFDTQAFPIYLDLLYPVSPPATASLPGYVMAPLPDYSGIDPAHGEDEFIPSALMTEVNTVAPAAAANPVSRMTFSFTAPRHLNYYFLHIFLPIILIILISWFTFFLRDYTRRIEVAASNILLFIAFSFSLASDFPRLGYITFVGALMAVTFVVNVLVLLYNVYMKRLETEGKAARVERIDSILDWAYPLLYAGSIAVVVVVFLI